MLNIFVNTWGNYNVNGADGGRWVTLPMDNDELTETLKATAEAMNDNDPEFFINDYEWVTEWDGCDINENESIEELNEYIQKLDDLDEWDQKKYCAAVEYWGREYVDIDELENYILYPDITDNYDLGYYWAVDSGCYNLRDMGHLSNYFDYEAFGRDIAIETDGGFTSFGFIERI